MYSYTLLWQTWEGSKCLSNRRERKGGRKKKNQTKKHEWSLCERPVIKLLGTSLHQKRHTHTHTHTHSHTNAQCILTFTLTSSDYWAVAVPPLIERVSVSEEKHNICRTRGGEKNKIKAQQGIILVSCVCVCVSPKPPHTHDPQPLCSSQYWKAQHTLSFTFEALCGSVYLMSCAKNSLFLFCLLFFLFVF